MYMQYNLNRSDGKQQTGKQLQLNYQSVGDHIVFKAIASPLGGSNIEYQNFGLKGIDPTLQKMERNETLKQSEAEGGGISGLDNLSLWNQTQLSQQQNFNEIRDSKNNIEIQNEKGENFQYEGHKDQKRKKRIPGHGILKSILPKTEILRTKGIRIDQQILLQNNSICQPTIISGSLIPQSRGIPHNNIAANDSDTDDQDLIINRKPVGTSIVKNEQLQLQQPYNAYQIQSDQNIANIQYGNQQNQRISPLTNMIEDLEDETSITDPGLFVESISAKIIQVCVENPYEQVGKALIKEPNKNLQQYSNQGLLINVENGMAKTYILLKLIKRLYQEDEAIVELTPEQLSMKRTSTSVRRSPGRPRVFILLTTNGRVDQQYNLMDRYISTIKVEKFLGGMKYKKAYQKENWDQKYKETDVFIFISKAFYDLLIHGYIHIEDTDYLVMDEAHLTNKDHVYSWVMNDFFYADYQFGITKRPKILAFAHSSLKSRTEPIEYYKDEIYRSHQNLANDLYSAQIPISQQEFSKFISDCEIDIAGYDSYSQEVLQRKLKNMLNEIKNHIQDLFNKFKQHHQEEKKSRNSEASLEPKTQKMHEQPLLEQENSVKIQLKQTNQGNEVDAPSDLINFDDKNKVIKVMIFYYINDQRKINNEVTISSENLIDMETTPDDLIDYEDHKIVDILSDIYKQLAFSSSDIAPYLSYFMIPNQLQTFMNSIRNQFQSTQNEYTNRVLFLAQDQQTADIMYNLLEDARIWLKTNRILVDLPEQPTFKCSVLKHQPIDQKTQQIQSKTPNKELECLIRAIAQHYNPNLKQLIQFLQQCKADILIATAQETQDLDISSFNFVTSFTDSINDLIRMKGKSSSKTKFLHICPSDKVGEDQAALQRQKDLINYTRDLYCFDEPKIEPSHDIISIKQSKAHKCFQTKSPFYAKCTTRVAPTLLDKLCSDILEKINNNKIRVEDLKPKNMFMNDKQNQEIVKYDSQRQLYKIIHQSTERYEEGKKYYSDQIVIPHILKYFFYGTGGAVQSGEKFLKKKEAENHCTFLVVESLYKLRLLGEDLYPQQEQFYTKIEPASKIIIEEIKKSNEQEESKNQGHTAKGPFNQSIVLEPEVVIQQQQENHVQQKRQTWKIQKIYNIVYHGSTKPINNKDQEEVKSQQSDLLTESTDYTDNKTQPFVSKSTVTDNSHQIDNTYPFKGGKEFLGIISAMPYQSMIIPMQQDSKQKLKNKQYLDDLVNLEMITQSQSQMMLQDQDLLSFQSSAIEINDYNHYSAAKDFVQHIKFFHVYTFYYTYNAIYTFYKKLLKRKFTFSYLFDDIINMLTKDFNIKQDLNFLKNVLGIKQINKVKFTDNELLEQKSFTVPTIKGKDNKFIINYNFIDQVLQTCKSDLLSFYLSDNKHIAIIQKYDLIQNDYSKCQISLTSTPNEDDVPLAQIQKSNYLKVNFVWNSLANQNIFLIHEQQQSQEPTQMIKQQEKDEKSKINQSEMNTSSVNNESTSGLSQLSTQSSINQSILDSTQSTTWNQKSINLVPALTKKTYPGYSERKLQQYGENLTVHEHYFINTGLYLDKKENPKIFKCYKERHFIDFSVQKTSTEESKNLDDNNSVTLFDIPQQLIRMSPFSYVKYQVHQASCFYYTFMNDLLKTQEFINTFFKNFPLHFQFPSDDKDPNKQQPESTPQDNFNLQQKDINPELYKVSKSDSKPNNLSSFMLQNNSVLIEALTSPTANRQTDYERLEFYGDTVISFLVVLELIITKDKSLKEGDLDYYRIKQVSNSNFSKINDDHGIYKYMITDQSQTLDDIIPPGFEVSEFYKIKQKNLNELKAKITFLKQQEYQVQKEKQRDDLTRKTNMYTLRDDILDYVSEEYEELVRMFLVQKNLKVLLYLSNPAAIIISKQEKQESKSLYFCYISRVAERWKYELLLTLNDLKLISIQANMQKVENKLEKMSKMKKKKAGPYIETENTTIKNVSQKQKADVIESITGAIACSAGLHSAQDFLRNLGILQKKPEEYTQRFNEIQQQRNDKLEQSFQPSIKKLQEILGYEFKNPTLLLQAFTHKSYKESFNSKKENQDNKIDDFERLEFLGDSILNFLISQFYFHETKNRAQSYKPKQLHKMKTTIINNVLISLVLIDKKLHSYILYVESDKFKEDFNNFVLVAETLLREVESMKYSSDSKSTANASGSSLKSTNISDSKSSDYINEAIDVDVLYEHSLKIFADVFEALLGAIFLDSGSIYRTNEILMSIITPFIRAYGNMDNIESLQDHSRTKLLELWNSKPYAKNLKISHRTETKDDGTLYFKGYVQNTEVRRVKFTKSQKNKVRKFYRDFFEFISEFLTQFESKGSVQNEVKVMEDIKVFRKNYQQKSSGHPTQGQTRERDQKQEIDQRSKASMSTKASTQNSMRSQTGSIIKPKN